MFNSVDLSFKGRVSLLILPVLFLWGCNKSETKTNPTAPSVEEKLEPTLESIQRNFVNRSCVSCHTEPTSLNRHVSLVDISKIIEKPGHVHGSGPHIRYLIKPGCPKQSFFLSIIRAGKMPPSEKVSQEVIDKIETFITNLDPQAGKMCDDEPGGEEDPLE